MNGTGTLGTGGLAVRVIGPIAIEPDHAPLHAPVGADHAAVLGDRIADGAPYAVGDQSAAGAEAARDRAVGPGPERHLLDLVDAFNPQVGVPEPAFLGGEAVLDRAEPPQVVAGRQLGIEARAPEIQRLFQPIRCGSRCAPSRRHDRRGRNGTKNPQASRAQARLKYTSAHAILPNPCPPSCERTKP